MLNPSKEHRILVVRPDALGDVSLMIPMLNTLKATFPKSSIYTLQQPYSKALLDNHPAIEEVLLTTEMGTYFQAVKWLKSFKFDAVILSYNDHYYASLMWAAGIPIRIGDANRLPLRVWINTPVSQPFRELTSHETQQNTRFVHALSDQVKTSQDMNMVVDTEALATAKALLQNEGWESHQPLICIHPTTGGGNRAWSPEKYGETIVEIKKERPDAFIMITGFGKNDEDTANVLLSVSNNQAVSLVGKTQLQELKAVVSLCSVVVGTDTGPTHIAAALNRPVVGISPTKFVKSLRWGPWDTPNKVVGHPEKCDLVCNPHTCTLPTCLEAIPVKEVKDAILSYLNDSLPAQDPHIWMKTSTTLAVYLSSMDGLEVAKKWQEKANEQGLRCHVIASSKKIAKAYDGTVSLVSSLWNYPKLLRFCGVQDITMFHVVGKKRSTVLLWLLRQCVAPLVYCPPILIQNSEHPPKDVIAFYRDLFATGGAT
jgi:ADP-heptose:LPS heptosyltransferase